MVDHADVVVVGAGAAGLMTAIFAGRGGGAGRVVVVDGAVRLGAKILVAGGGRCNVTHERVDERAFCGSSPAAIRQVLRRFDVADTVAFFRDLGVALKTEETGKLFPVTDRARTVLDALLRAARGAGVELRHPWRVERAERAGAAHEGGRADVGGEEGAGAEGQERDGGGEGFVVSGPAGLMRCRRLVLATGGRSLPRTGSDGHGYALARGLGHTLTERIFPALVPLVLPDDHFIRALSGVSTPATVEVRTGTGRRLVALTGALLCTHFGLSGPVVLDVSRHYLAAAGSDPAARLLVKWLPGETFGTVDTALQQLGRASAGRRLAERLPERLARALCAEAGVDPSAPGHALDRETRRRLARTLTEMPVPVAGDRGFRHAEVTAGGVPLRELHLDTMASRVCPGLHLVGEICDVDGRIGGFNFQWAWASGFVAGRGIGVSEDRDTDSTRDQEE